MSAPARPPASPRSAPDAPRATAARRPTSVERFAARARRSRRRPGTALWCLLGLLLSGAVAAWVLFASPLLTVRTVTVTGVPTAAAAEVRQRAAVPIGRPLARVDTSAVAARALAPDLAAVTVHRSFPATLVISVQPRVAVLAVRNPEGQVEVRDRYGIAFGTMSTPPAGVPVLDPGQRPLTPAAVAAVSTVLQSLPTARRGEVSHVSVSDAGLVSFRLGRLEVVWGDASDSALKQRVLNALARTARSRIDVSAPRTPAVR